LTAKTTERIMPGVVCMAQGAWVAPDENGFDGGGCASTLLPEEHSLKKEDHIITSDYRQVPILYILIQHS